MASGEVSEREALFVLATLLSSSLAILLQLNWLRFSLFSITICNFLSVFIGASSMFLVVSYPLAKRYTNWPQLILGQCERALTHPPSSVKVIAWPKIEFTSLN